MSSSNSENNWIHSMGWAERTTIFTQEWRGPLYFPGTSCATVRDISSPERAASPRPAIPHLDTRSSNNSASTITSAWSRSAPVMAYRTRRGLSP